MKADLSTFNIEIVQISKRIAPKSGLRWPAPHPHAHLRGPPSAAPAVTSFGLAARGSAACPGKQRKSLTSRRLTPGAETWGASPALALALALGAASPLAASLGSARPDVQPAPHSQLPGRGSKLFPSSP